MTHISRLHDTEISNGLVVNADDLDAELNQLVSESNDQDDRLTSLESQTMTIGGVKSFSSSIKADTINEYTTGNGVFVDGVKFKDGYFGVKSIRVTISGVDTGTNVVSTTSAHGLTTGDKIKLSPESTGTLPGGTTETAVYYARVLSSTTITLHPTASDASLNTNVVDITSAQTGTIYIVATPASLSEFDFWMDGDGAKIRLNGVTRTLFDSVTFNGMTINGITGKAPTYTSAATITIPAGLTVADSTNTKKITVGTALVPSLAVSGLNGLDTGSEASNTWYYVYLIMDLAGTVGSVFSVTNESVTGSITLPAGYVYKRQLPLAIRNDGSSNIINFTVTEGWPYRPFIQWETIFDQQFATSTTNILNAGAATSWTSLNGSSFIPPISRQATFFVNNDNNNSYSIQLRTPSATGYWRTKNWVQYENCLVPITTNASQQIEYQCASALASFSVAVFGYLVDQM